MYTYLLIDDGGVSNSENEILIPIGTKFRHEFGYYKVINYRNSEGDIETRMDKITQVECDRYKKH